MLEWIPSLEPGIRIAVIAAAVAVALFALMPIKTIVSRLLQCPYVTCVVLAAAAPVTAFLLLPNARDRMERLSGPATFHSLTVTAVGTEGAILAIVVGLTTVAVQMAAGNVSPRTVTLFLRSWLIWSLLGFFVACMIWTLLFGLPSAASGQRAASWAVHSVLWSFVAAILLVPVYAGTVVAALRPERVIRWLLSHVHVAALRRLVAAQHETHEYMYSPPMLEDAPDPIQPLTDAATRLLRSGDIAAFRLAVAAIGKVGEGLLDTDDDDALAGGILHVSYHLRRLMREAMAANDEEAGTVVLEFWGLAGPWLVAEKNNGYAALQAVQSIWEFTGDLARMQWGDALGSALSGLDHTAAAVLQKQDPDDRDLPHWVLDELLDTGRRSLAVQFDEGVRLAAQAIGAVARAGAAAAEADIVVQGLVALDELGVKAAKQGMVSPRTVASELAELAAAIPAESTGVADRVAEVMVHLQEASTEPGLVKEWLDSAVEMLGYEDDPAPQQRLAAFRANYGL